MTGEPQGVFYNGGTPGRGFSGNAGGGFFGGGYGFNGGGGFNSGGGLSDGDGCGMHGSPRLLTREDSAVCLRMSVRTITFVGYIFVSPLTALSQHSPLTDTT